MKILVGISGGVDSAFATKKLLDLGHEVEGAVLVMHEHTELSAACEAAQSLGIKLHEIDCTAPFEAIKDNFVNEYTNGRTPNPCIICNERVKFKYLYDFAMENGFDRIATGHYARVESDIYEGKKRYFLAFPEDMKKEQTYMLYRLPQNILAKLVLPLSEGKKSDLRLVAKDAGISAAERDDSQEICFLPDGNYAEYIESKSGKCPEGDFVDESGKILGRHKGIIHYTVGQRKGLGISLGYRAFVTNIDPETGRITLSESGGGKTEIYINNIVYSGMLPPKGEKTLDFEVKLRYTAPLVKTKATLYPDGKARLVFDREQKCAPGQSAVMYLEGRVMCGGFIEG